MTSQSDQLTLTISPTAWQKILYMLKKGKTEVGGMGITYENPLCIREFHLVEANCTPASVEFTESGIADFFDKMDERNLQPNQYFRIWIHTHPTFSPKPSGTDENTFNETFGTTDFAIMLIVASANSTYARIRMTVNGITIQQEANVQIDWQIPCEASDINSWEDEYKQNIKERK